MSINDEFNDGELMSPEYFANLCNEVSDGMRQAFYSSTAQVLFPSKVDAEITENGTGSFIDVGGKIFLLSNEHVLNKPEIEVASSYGTSFLRISKKPVIYKYPVDIGLMEIDGDSFSRDFREGKTVDISLFANKHDTVDHEIIWYSGFPGARQKQFDSIYLPVMEAHATQELLPGDRSSIVQEFKSDYHFLISYSPEKAISCSEADRSRPISNPNGLSGSLVWNTRRIECLYRGEQWSPEKAVVTGVVWGWKDDYLIATKVEKIKPLLLSNRFG